MALVLRYSTVTAALLALKAKYKEAKGFELYRIANKLRDHLDAGDVTDLQCRNAFGLNLTQWNNLKTKMTNYSDIYKAAMLVQGE